MIYLDDDYKAHAEQDSGSTRTPWEDTEGFFAGKCAAFIEGYRVVPVGSIWTREDGEQFAGLMITPAENPTVLQAAQAAYDQSTIEALDAEVVELTYQNILLELEVE